MGVPSKIYRCVFCCFPDRFEVRFCRGLFEDALGIALKHPIALDPHQLLAKQWIHLQPHHLRPKRVAKSVRRQPFYPSQLPQLLHHAMHSLIAQSLTHPSRILTEKYRTIRLWSKQFPLPSSPVQIRL